MTDEQIIKALRCCGMRDCGKCPYVGFKEECSNLSILALDLINRQNAEIERLKRGVTFTFTIEDFESIKETIISNIDNKIKSEAIKEFAERLKDDIRLDEECKYNCISCCYECKEFVPQIDKLVKEMTEAQE